MSSSHNFQWALGQGRTALYQHYQDTPKESDSSWQAVRQSDSNLAFVYLRKKLRDGSIQLDIRFHIVKFLVAACRVVQSRPILYRAGLCLFTSKPKGRHAWEVGDGEMRQTKSSDMSCSAIIYHCHSVGCQPLPQYHILFVDVPRNK